MRPALNLSNQQIGNWTVLRCFGETSRHEKLWRCRCNCGHISVLTAAYIKAGLTRSCRSCRGRLSVTHGHTRHHQKSPTYKTWRAMMNRCHYPSQNNYRHYGGRGIRVCRRWRKFASFLADMGKRPKGKTLDRRRVNGHYTPSNCRWATQSEQLRNRRHLGRF